MKKNFHIAIVISMLLALLLSGCSDIEKQENVKKDKEENQSTGIIENMINNKKADVSDDSSGSSESDEEQKADGDEESVLSTVKSAYENGIAALEKKDYVLALKYFSFCANHDYKDSKQKCDECNEEAYLAGISCVSKEQWREAADIFLILKDYEDSKSMYFVSLLKAGSSYCLKEDYEKVIEVYKEVENFVEQEEDGEWMDSEFPGEEYHNFYNEAEDCIWEYGEKLATDEDYDKAMQCFLVIDCEEYGERFCSGIRAYHKGLALYNIGKTEEALDYFIAASEVKITDSYPYVRELRDGVIDDGDTIWIGYWEQDGNTDNGPEPIEWVVLNRYNDNLLVLAAKNVLATHIFCTDEQKRFRFPGSELLSYMNCNNPAEEDFNYLNIFPEEQRKYLKPWPYWCTECSNEAVLGLMDYSDVWKYQELVGEDGISKTNYSLKLPQDLINSRSYFWLDNTEERVVAQTKVYSTVLSYDYYNPEGTCAVCAVNGWKRYGLSLDYRYDINDKSLGIVPKLYISLDLTSNPYFDDVNNLRIQ